jgi:hypothetical protein
MGYLQDQAVQVYAGTAARGSAIGTAVSEGMVSYLSDSNVVQAYTGSSWDSLAYQSSVDPLTLPGRVIQTAYNIQDTLLTTTAGYPGVTTNLSTTITPRFANSRMIIIVSNFVQPVSFANSFDAGVGIWRNNSTDLGGNSLTANAGTGASGALAIRHLASIVREDYPNTTSPVSYNTRIWLTSGLRMEAQPGGQRSTITVFEVRV